MMTTAVDERVPPLAAGDKLSRAEFLRRWEADPKIKRAELVGGIVYMPPPVSVEHGEMENAVGCWLGTYAAATPGTRCGHNTTSLLLKDTPQPDLYLRILPECGGGSRIVDNYLAGRPELLVEVCRSSASYDLHVKFELYQEAKVPEYLTILLFENEIRWHVLVGDQYDLLLPDGASVWRSRVFPGLWLDGPALLARDTQRVLARLQEGLRSPEHARFVAELSARNSTSGAGDPG